jgi:DNA processing protein
MDKEKMFYNAVAIALEGNPSSVRTLRKRTRKKGGNHFGEWQTAYEMLASKPRDPAAEWEKLERAGVRLIFRDERNFPPLLREMHHPPLAIYARGDLPESIVRGEALAIVGTRRATPDGKIITKRFARVLAEAGRAIVSGLALGIDAAAHEGCLEAPNGKTIAVLAGGLDNFYPAENERLGCQILERGGAIISEYPLGEPPYPDRFLERNRIVCGLARGVLVVECPQRSGSLATATYAREQNRDLFVVPGSITHPNFFGSHQLIRQGAELVTAPEEILETYGLLEKRKASREASATNDEERQVLHALHDAAMPLDVDKIIELTKLEPRVVNQTLSFLVLKHLVKETEAGYIIE